MCKPQTGDDLGGECRESDPFEACFEVAHDRCLSLSEGPREDREREHEVPSRPDGGAEQVQAQHDVIRRHFRSRRGRAFGADPDHPS